VHSRVFYSRFHAPLSAGSALRTAEKLFDTRELVKAL